jgi:hypothetical protein
MAHELIASVTAAGPSPSPITIGLGETVDITASYALNGPNPNGPSTSDYSLVFTRVFPPPGHTWDSQDPAVADTDYTKTWANAALNKVGKYILRVVGTCLTDVDITSVNSNDIIVHVVPFSEEHGAPGTHTEETAASGSMSEESAAAGSMAEESAASGSMSEENSASGNWTEG